MTLSACALAIAACAPTSHLDLSQHQQAPALVAARSFSDAPQRPWPVNTWWQTYGDAQLTQLMDDALAGSPTLAAAVARLDMASGYAQQAGAMQQPTADLSLSASRQKLSYNNGNDFVPRQWNNFGSALLSVGYDLDFWGRNHDLVAAAISDVAAAEAETASAQIALTSGVAQAYVELARLYANRDTAQTAVDIRRQTTKLFRQRYDNGLETQGSVRQVEALLAAADADLQAVDESIALQRNALAALVGQGPDRGLTITRPQLKLDQVPGLPTDVGVGLVGHRPEVIAARWRAEAAAERVGVAKADFYPDIRLTAFGGVQAMDFGRLDDGGSEAGSFGASLYLPLFSGGRLEGQLTTAEASYRASVASYNATVINALREVADVVVSSKALDGRLHSTETAVAAARDAYQIANNRYRGGLANYLDVLTAQEALLNSQRALVNLQSRAYALDVALNQALGGGYAAPRS